MKEKIIKLARKTISLSGNIISFALFASILYFLIVGGYKAYQYLFTQIEMPFSVSLTDYSKLKANGRDSCDIFVEKYLYPVEFVIARPIDQMTSTKVLLKSNNKLEFNLYLPGGSLSATSYSVDGTTETINFTEDFNQINGKADEVYIDYSKDTYFSMRQYYCEPTIEMRFPGSYYLLSYPNESRMRSVGFEQYISEGSSIQIVISNPSELADINLKQDIKKIVYTFKSTIRLLPLSLFAKATDLDATMPIPSRSYSGDITEGLRIFTDEIEIENPAGKLKFGNNNPLDLLQIASMARDKISIPQTKVGDYSNTYFIEWKAKNNTEITGEARSLLLNDEDLGKAPWYSLPDYVQAGLFGLLISLLGGLWAVRGLIGRQIILAIPFWTLIDPTQPPQGSFVCVTNSGMVIAGELVKKPSRNYPYYLIKNARRRIQVSDKWEKQVISEIKIGKDAIEQSYYL